MRLAIIDNKYMYDVNDHRGKHKYALYYDKKKHIYKAVQLTHVIEPSKQNKLNKGYLKIVKFPGIKYLSGIHNKHYIKDVNGQHINIKSSSVKFLNKGRHLPKSISKKIIRFSGRRVHK